MPRTKRLLGATDLAVDDVTGAILTQDAGVSPGGFCWWPAVGDAHCPPYNGAWRIEAACRIRIKRCDGQSAVVSLDGGVTNHIYALANVTDSQWYAVEPGAVITARNAVPGRAATNLIVEWGT